MINKNSGKCVDAKGAGTVSGTAIQQYTCNASAAQQYQFATTSGGYVRINQRGNSAQALDVTDVSTADNAKIQTWTYGGGNNQQWQPVAEGGGYYHFVIDIVIRRPYAMCIPEYKTDSVACGTTYMKTPIK